MSAPHTMADHPRVAFATTRPEGMLGPDPDRPFHEAAFARAGVQLDHLMWWDKHAAWDSYDVVVVRSTWDYVEHLGDYKEWLFRMRSHAGFHNPAEVIEWNLDKRYLLDLAERGVPVVPTEIAPDRTAAAAVLDQHMDQVVIKPTTSAGSRLTGRFRADDPAALTLASRIFDDGFDVMIQPAVPSVAARGETGTLVFSGERSHSFVKLGLLADDGRPSEGDHDDHILPGVLSDAETECVGRVVAAVGALVADRFGVDAPLLYERIDLVLMDDGTPAVLEVELAEPCLYLGLDEQAADRFCAAVLKRLATS